MEVIILGSGTSHGVPMIGCDCEVCTSDDPRDRRTRPSIFVRVGGCHFLVDTAPELRLQCLANNIKRLDAVLFTHHHADHVMGLDDLRRFNWIMKRKIPCYGSQQTVSALQRMFSYAFDPKPGSPHSSPQLELHAIDSQPFAIGGETIIPIPLMHGPMPVLGLRFGRFAYCTDCNVIPEESLALLRDLDVLVLDALRNTPHPTHFTIDQAVEMAQRIGAKTTYFTHMTHELGHEATNRKLPKGMALAFDGLRIAV
ncbi:MAG: MBL fold metallo-hydrolase [Planctomycetes bacterium]|nr:MBL fold metallo-hydrolase [Planctomycetota bacterium]